MEGEGDDGEDSFVWTWSLESSEGTIESEPDPDYLDLVRGTEMFVEKTLHQQETYVEMHNLQPGLFYDTVML
ncbi:hypothetical protein J6590_068323 [Homalodisca vitripennis]|nr:hypothetical protein J6590_068323 [Homalodisca vitripennis]